MLTSLDRRQFACLAAGVSASAAFSNQANDPLSVAVIGHTGRGDYGHGLDTVWQRLPETRVVAVADPVESDVTNAGDCVSLWRAASSVW